MKGIACLKKSDGSLLVCAATNSGQLKTFNCILPNQVFHEAGDTNEYAIITLKNGKKMKQEFYWGNAYLSSSGRYAWYDVLNTAMIEFYDAHGKSTKSIKK
jgi:enediyne biosynthesis protein E4